MNYLWTDSKLEDEDWWDDDDVARKTNYDDFASFWGGGGGLLLRLREGSPRNDDPAVYLDIKVSHTRGAEAKYLTEGDVELDDGVPVFNGTESKTDLTAYQVGVTLTF